VARSCRFSVLALIPRFHLSALSSRSMKLKLPVPGEGKCSYKSPRWWAFTLCCAVVPLAGALLVLIGTTGAFGGSGCACRGTYPDSVPEAQRAGQPVSIDGIQYYYPLGYGLHACRAHDAGLLPYCVGANATWCEALWCFADANSCDDTMPSVYFPHTELAYSFVLCGADHEGYSRGTPTSHFS